MGLIVPMQFTYAMILIGSLSLMGVPFLAGFYSKELFIELMYGRYDMGLVYMQSAELKKRHKLPSLLSELEGLSGAVQAIVIIISSGNFLIYMRAVDHKQKILLEWP